MKDITYGGKPRKQEIKHGKVIGQMYVTFDGGIDWYEVKGQWE